ncbi:gliding motility protein [Flavobacterium sp. WW92]|uniref:type IX secretion system periplasmic lipoprotein PorW/SprE n=1 Tax=unclassified Flavobacterium TaxID=196869 RepID=UPI002225B2C5|nr:MULTISPECIES: tetratricopeptide repeat protein [unclassified Flavobacterium]WDO13846.1 gliding motility protein [Flavobacterium sp. WW92]
MKTNILKYALLLGFFAFLIACSTKKDTFINRNMHALSTEYNILYNGEIALQAGITELKTQYKDNFWEILPVERMQVNQETMLPGDKKNPNFERAETKAIKAIQKHSMYIEGGEKNPQMDEAHLLLGKARYYDQRFVPALEAFNYILYKYPNSDKIYEAKIWREKTNMRMENDALAVKNLRKLLEEIKFKDQIFADANATLAQAFLNIEEKDSAISKLKLAVEYTKESEERARYYFILGQLYDSQHKKDSAIAAYQSVIDMKRKSPRRYVIQAHAKQAQYFDYKSGDTLAFVEKYKDLLEDRENRPYLDVINHQMGLFYDALEKDEEAKKYYNKSLRANSQDNYQIASNYRNLAEINFNDAKYSVAGQYYDSTLVRMDQRTREYKAIKKKRENLVDVIKYEAIAKTNDSILHIVALSDDGKKSFFDEVIARLKKEDEEKAKKALLVSQSQPAGVQNSDATDEEVLKSASKAMSNKSKQAALAEEMSMAPPAVGGSTASNFYFYNPTTVAYGKNEFRKNWGNRTLKDNWRLSQGKSKIGFGNDDTGSEEVASSEETDTKEEKIDVRYTVDYYLKQLPTEQKAIDSLAKERNFAYYQLGLIYKDKFKRYELATGRLEKLLENNPEERLILPSMYNLYKIYEVTNREKAEAMKQRIISQYPESRYATILKSSPADLIKANDTPDAAYNKLFKIYESGRYQAVITESDALIELYAGEDIIPKIELLKANTIGKLKGLEEYKGALNYVALNYPNSKEGKEAESLLATNIPQLETIAFDKEIPVSWKILYKVGSNPDDKNTKILQDKIKKFVSERTIDKLSTSFDVYTVNESFVAIHGIKTEENAKDIASILKDYKDYKIADSAIIISNENYKVVQIKKNLVDYLTIKKP